MFKIEFTPSSSDLLEKDKEDIFVGEAIETIYASYNPDIKIFWNEYQLHLSAKANLSDMYTDLVFILNKLQENEAFYCNILSSSLTAKWMFSFRDEGNIEIEPIWYTANMTKEGEEIVNVRDVKTNLLVDKKNFINQWNNLLSMVKVDLIKSGYNNSLEDYSYLEEI